MKVKNKSPNSPSILIGLALLVIGIAQISALWALQRAIFPTVNSQSSWVKVQPAKFSPQAYWLAVSGNRLILMPKLTADIAATSPELALKKAFDSLLTTASDSKLTTTIPENTRLLNLQLTKQGIYVDLSPEFSQGGGSTSMIYRVAQVLYTATSLEPDARVFLSMAGQPLDENHPLGGEGLLLEYPLTREKFARDFLFE